MAQKIAKVFPIKNGPSLKIRRNLSVRFIPKVPLLATLVSVIH